MIVPRTLILALLYILSISNGHAFDLDYTVEDEIRKNYNSSKLIEDNCLNLDMKNDTSTKSKDEKLPELPSILQQSNQQKTTTITKNPTNITTLYKKGNIKIKKGTSFDVINESSISDWQRKGTKVRFLNKKIIYGKYYSIPANTIFQGEIIESHSPQITCNGGLVVIRINSMIYKGQTIPLNAYVTKANGSKIFLNNIKGDRTFLKTMWKKGDWGRSLMNKMFNLTLNLGADGTTLALSPFPITYGTICLGLSTITSPISAFFTKGGHVSIPAGSQFRIKLLEESFID